MKRLLIPLMAASVAIGGAAPVLAYYGELNATTNDFAIIIDGKTKNIELWVTRDREGAERVIKFYSGLHSSTGVYASGGAFSGDGAGGRIIGRGKCTLPPIAL